MNIRWNKHLTASPLTLGYSIERYPLSDKIHRNEQELHRCLIDLPSLPSPPPSVPARLPDGDLTLPQTWGDYFVDKLRRGPRGVDGAERCDRARRRSRSRATVLLITGVTIKAAWLDPIAARLRRDGFRPVVYEPPGPAQRQSVPGVAPMLGAVVDRMRARERRGQDRHPRRVHGRADRPALHPVARRRRARCRASSRSSRRSTACQKRRWCRGS